MILNEWQTPNGKLELLESVNLGIHLKLDGTLIGWDYKDWLNVRHQVNKIAEAEVWPMWTDGGSTMIFSRAAAV